MLNLGQWVDGERELLTQHSCGPSTAEPAPSALPGSLEVLTRASVALMLMLPNWTGATKSLENPQ